MNSLDRRAQRIVYPAAMNAEEKRAWLGGDPICVRQKRNSDRRWEFHRKKLLAAEARIRQLEAALQEALG